MLPARPGIFSGNGSVFDRHQRHSRDLRSRRRRPFATGIALEGLHTAARAANAVARPYGGLGARLQELATLRAPTSALRGRSRSGWRW